MGGGPRGGQARMVEGTCEDTKSRVLCEPGVSGESKVIVDLTRGSVFVQISRKIYTEDIPRTLLNEDDLAVTANGVANIQNQLIEWKDIFSRHRLRVSLEKTEVMWWDIEGKSCKYTWMGRSLSKETVLFTWME